MSTNSGAVQKQHNLSMTQSFPFMLHINARRVGKNVPGNRKKTHTKARSFLLSFAVIPVKPFLQMCSNLNLQFSSSNLVFSIKFQKKRDQ